MKHISDLYFKLTGDNRDYPTFQFNSEKVLDYSNDLEKGKIKYLETILNNYCIHIADKFKDHSTSFPETFEKIKSVDQIIKESKFYKEIAKRIGQLKKFGEEVIINNSFDKAIERISKLHQEGIKKKRKEMLSPKNIFKFDFAKVQKYCYELESIDERILYLEYVKKEYLNSKNSLDFDFTGEITFNQKIINEISYLKNIKSPSKDYTENFSTNEIKINEFTIQFDILALKDELKKHILLENKIDYLQFLKKELSGILLYPNLTIEHTINKHNVREIFRTNGSFKDYIKEYLLPFIDSELNFMTDFKLNNDPKEYTDKVKVDYSPVNNKIPDNSLNNDVLKNNLSFMKKQKEYKEKIRIEWRLGQTDLIDFFEILYKYNLITKNTYESMNVVIRDCFTDENGKNFDNQNIAKLKIQKSKKSKNYDKIDKSISEFNKKKPSI